MKPHKRPGLLAYLPVLGALFKMVSDAHDQTDAARDASSDGGTDVTGAEKVAIAERVYDNARSVVIGLLAKVL